MKTLIHGARWWKFDFHNHTPASSDFGKGDAAYKKISPREWLLMYMAQGLDCVAITDHNSGEWIDLLKVELEKLVAEKPNGFRHLVLFPGVEISAQGNTHILAIFDPNSGTKKIQALLGAVSFPVDSFGTSDAVTQNSVEEVILQIHKAGGIAIPAHVDSPCGLFVNQSGNTLKQALLVEGLLAIEVMNPATVKPDTYAQSKLKLSEVVGSDSHISSQVGSKYTWVKMGTPSLDALKLALHDGEDGVLRYESGQTDPNNIANRYFIKTVYISHGFKAGNGSPMMAEFSPWLTSVIGGRGSGKSSVINYLRIALNRTDEMPEEVQREFDKFFAIGSKQDTGMLRSDTAIAVELVKDAKVHRILWKDHVHTIEEWDVTTSAWGPPTGVSNIKDLFPIQIFSQKELYALTGDPQKLLELIDSQFDKKRWSDEQNKLVERWIADRATARQLSNIISEESNVSAELKQTANRIALLESSEFKDILGRFNKLSETNKYFTDMSTRVSTFIEQVKAMENSIPQVGIPESVRDSVAGDSLAFQQTLESRLASVGEKLREVRQLLQPYDKDLTIETRLLGWFSEFEKSKAEYDAIEHRIQELGPETYEVLIQRRSDLNEKLARITEQKEQLSQLQGQLTVLHETILKNEMELRTKRREVVDRWKAIDDQKNPFLTIELHSMADPEDADQSFRQILRKTGREFENHIYGFNEDTKESWGLIADIINEPEVSRWEKRASVLEEFLSAGEHDKKTLDMRLAKHLDYLKASTPEDIDRMAIWVPEDKLVLKFRKNGKEEDIQSGSAGERTAGMLGLLLAINDTPLLIDQPEDDLDSKLISSFVVDGFKKLKKSRQLVIVTHNPNITVNANSDNVVHMDFVAGQIVVAANDALQNKEIRIAVCEVMEGGREALDKRYYRISKALANSQ